MNKKSTEKIENKLKLKLIGLPELYSIDDISEETHVSEKKIFHLSKFAKKYYRTYEINKSSGGKRKIYQPSQYLKGIQSWILNKILNRLQTSSASRGFEKGSSIKDNAMYHKDANCIMTIDLKDFFCNISQKDVFFIFRRIGYTNEVATILSKLCTVDNMLPQGGPCSPKLANLVLWKLDLRLQGYLASKRIQYTRYADDLSFSSYNPEKLVKCLSFIKFIIQDEGFEINKKKTRIMGPSRRKMVTGLVISDNQCGIGTQKYRKLRAKVHKYSLMEDSEDKNIELEKINGWLSYLQSVDKQRCEKLKKYMNKILPNATHHAK